MNTRQQDIIHLLEQRGEITIKELAEILDVTTMTIYRDIDYLEDQRYLYKKRGAAVFINAPDRKTTTFYADEKNKIGKKAAEYIHPGQSVLFDNSTTAIEAAKHLHDIPNLTFYTTNLEIATIVAKYPDTILYCSGGYYFPESKGFVGEQAEAFVSKLHADVCIIGASGISVEAGITNPYPMHSNLQRKIIEAADTVLLLADHSKFDKTALEKAASLSEIDRIITDSGISEKLLEKYREHVFVEVV